MKYFAVSEGREHEIVVSENADGTLDLTHKGKTLRVDVREISHGHLYSVLLGHRSHDVTVEPCDEGVEIHMDGRVHPFSVVDETARELEKAGGARKKNAGGGLVKAQMPGLVLSVNVKPGDAVEKGSVLLVLEAMKMQNEITAQGPARVKAVKVNPGATVAAGELLVELEG
ncbi:MAG: biotin/lipoyl-containing protein [Planctomycetota bacterium]